MPKVTALRYRQPLILSVQKSNYRVDQTDQPRLLSGHSSYLQRVQLYGRIMDCIYVAASGIRLATVALASPAIADMCQCAVMTDEATKKQILRASFE